MDEIFVAYASPAQTITLIFEVLNSDGYRVNSPTIPSIAKVFDPSLAIMSEYPKDMDQIDEGLYSFSFTMPIGSESLGTFIIDLIWTNPDTDLINQTFYQIISRLQPSMSGGYIVGVR